MKCEARISFLFAFLLVFFFSNEVTERDELARVTCYAPGKFTNTYTHMYTRIHTCIHVYTHMHIHINTYLCRYVCIYLHCSLYNHLSVYTTQIVKYSYDFINLLFLFSFLSFLPFNPLIFSVFGGGAVM